MIERLPIVACIATLALPAGALTLIHPHGELIDTGSVTARFDASYPNIVDCAVPRDVLIKDRVITITARALPRGVLPNCGPGATASLGQLDAGWWRVVLRILDSQLTAVVEQRDSEWKVGRANTRCNPYPAPRSAVVVEHRSASGLILYRLVTSDPAYAALLGNPLEVRPFLTFWGAILYYPGLENPYDRAAALMATGEFISAVADSPVCLGLSPPPQYGTAIEFHHAGLDHYFYAANAEEAASLDHGTGAQGWIRTGRSFRVLVRPGCVFQHVEQAAYRFFGKPGIGPSSHVFTVDREECRVVEKSGAWQYEGSPFWATPPGATGGCANADEIPLHRLWKAFGDSNHRFTTELSVVAEMEAKGWLHEGVAMCVKKPPKAPQ